MANDKLVLHVRIPNDRRLPDTNSHVNRFQIKSASSDSLYTIAQSRSGRWWSCGCRGWIRHKRCKHLTELRLPGNHMPFEATLPAPENN